MNNRRSRAYYGIVLLVLGATGWGCITTSYITPEDVPIYAGERPILPLANGRVVRFIGDTLSVDTTATGLVFRGKALEYLNPERTRTRPYADSILSQDIVCAEVRQKTILYYTGPALFIGAGIAILLVYLPWILKGR